MKRTRRSYRQICILAELSNAPVRLLADMARRMNVMRPSISHSVSLLRKEGLVEKEDKAWVLTSKGVKELDTIKSLLASEKKEILIRLSKINSILYLKKTGFTQK